MQEAAWEEIQAIREVGKDKGFIISATGTGKAYFFQHWVLVQGTEKCISIKIALLKRREN